ncbi:MAG: UbiH/UbiF/VisC/COQ6 family ubiquinone biosynthesis hydroxylase [Magnetospirillum sp.]|nr:UbiH/UbiF/VisC/COQ6 family ubiquinone biosynthesis hydroxylase [Magnetospirillum sp.]
MSHPIDASRPSAAPPADVPPIDVLIVGGGPVGGTAAALLAQAGLDVAVIEAGDPALLSRPDSDGRAISVALSGQRVLAGAGIWDRLAHMAQPILDIRVTDGDAPVFLHYDHAALGDDPFGWIVENEAIKAAVFARLAELSNLRLLAKVRLAGLDIGPGLATATLDDGRRVRASLVVAADGRGSPTRAAAGIGITRWDYRQHGIVCAIAHEIPHEGVAHEHFLPAGPFAILPMTGNRSGIVWTERAALAPAIVAQDDGAFLAELSAKVGGLLGRLSLAGSRFAYPLSLQIAERIVDRRLALIGDAAHGMHPIAGQGMNMGLRDVAALAEAVVDARRYGLDPGAPDVLARYRRWRRFDTLVMLAVTDGLNRLFSNGIAPVRLARGLGLAAVERMPGLKRTLMRHAMGLAGDLPRLLKGEPL